MRQFDCSCSRLAKIAYHADKCPIQLSICLGDNSKTHFANLYSLIIFDSNGRQSENIHFIWFCNVTLKLSDSFHGFVPMYLLFTSNSEPELWRLVKTLEVVATARRIKDEATSWKVVATARRIKDEATRGNFSILFQADILNFIRVQVQ